jgi:hypothetical protein
MLADTLPGKVLAFLLGALRGWQPLRGVFATAAWLLLVLLVSRPAQGQSETVHRSPHKEETVNIIGIKGGPVNVFREGGHAIGGGFSPFYERNVIPGWLEIEAAAAFVWVDEDTVVSFEVFVKKPFHVSESINPYVGLGPSLSVVISPEETRAHAGILGTLGSYFWPRASHWGVDVELVYLLLFEGGLAHELTFEVGPVVRF